MKKILFIAFITLLSSAAFAQTRVLPPEEPPVPLDDESVTTTAPTVTPTETDLSTRAFRGLTLYSGAVHFSPLSTWLPLKYGITAGYNYSSDWTFEAELTTKSYGAGLLGVDFAQVTDQRYGVQGRWYPGSNSLNFIFGFFRSEFTAELGDAILSRTGAPSGTVLGFKSFGPLVGLGNRWQWRYGMTIGVDWIAMYVPLIDRTTDDKALKAVTNQTDRSDLDKVTSAINRLPQFDVLKLSFGYAF